MILFISNKDVNRYEYIFGVAAMGFDEGEAKAKLEALIDQIQEEKVKSPYTMYLREKEKENEQP